MALCFLSDTFTLENDAMCLEDTRNQKKKLNKDTLFFFIIENQAPVHSVPGVGPGPGPSQRASGLRGWVRAGSLGRKGRVR